MAVLVFAIVVVAILAADPLATVVVGYSLAIATVAADYCATTVEADSVALALYNTPAIRDSLRHCLHGANDAGFPADPVVVGALATLGEGDPTPLYNWPIFGHRLEADLAAILEVFSLGTGKSL